MDLLQQLQSKFGDVVEARNAAPEDAIDDVQPQVIATPRDEAAAQALVAWCGREKQAFMACGGGTKLSIGARPERCDLIISTANLNAIVEHDEGNATVAAQAGIRLDRLNNEVGKQKQFVPLEGVEVGSRATLGGVIATNHSGLKRLKYGTPRDLVVGLHAVLSDGRLVKAGSKVVKNVSGYDLNKIFIGSSGSLGLITEVTVRLLPNYATSASWQGSYSSLQEAIDQAQAIFAGPFEPSALRITVNAAAIHLLAHFEGGEKAVQAQMNRLAVPAQIEQPVHENPAQLQLRAALPLQDAVKWAQRVLDTNVSSMVWDYGVGIIRVGYETLPRDAVALVSKLRTEAEAQHGFLVVERAPSQFKTPDFVWGAPRADLVLMQKLKNAYDNAQVCAPGRFMRGC